MTLVQLPFGVFILTSLYLVFCVLVVFYVPTDCLDKPCSTEDEVDDDSILAWATNFLTSLGMFILALHLQFFIKGSGSAVLAQCSMAVAQVIVGLERMSIVDNDSGGRLNDHDELYCIFRIMALTFMTLSAYQVYRFVQQQNRSLGYQDSPRTLPCVLLIALMLVVLAWATAAGGYIWRILQLEELGHSATVNTGETSLQLASSGETAWCIAYSLLWIPVSLLLRRVILHCKQVTESGNKTKLVCGSSTSLACIGIAILPWTIGTMLPVWLDIASIILDIELVDMYDYTYGAVVYNFGVLLGFFLFHNVATAIHEYQNDPQLHTESSSGWESKVDAQESVSSGDDTSKETDAEDEWTFKHHNNNNKDGDDDDDDDDDDEDDDDDDEKKRVEENAHINWVF